MFGIIKNYGNGSLAKGDKMEKVLVTGGSGYIGLHCISELLKEGYTVRTSLRSMDRKKEITDALSGLIKNDETLEFCKLDLMKDDGWDEAVRGCDYVLHVASPVYEKNMKDENSFIDPAKQGLIRALKPAIKYKIKRFVMTSSIAAITQGHEDLEIDEKSWSIIEKDTLPYIKSKTYAEEAMWSYMDEIEETNKIEVCTINPSFVFGPSLSYDMGASNLLIRSLLVGKLPALAKIQFNVVNVVDVAKAHILALKSDCAAGQRFIVSEKVLDIRVQHVVSEVALLRRLRVVGCQVEEGSFRVELAQVLVGRHFLFTFALDAFPERALQHHYV